MSVLQFGGVYGDVDDPLLHGLTAFQPIEIDGTIHLAALGRNGLSVLRVGVDGALSVADQVAFSAAFLPGWLPGLSVLTLDGAPQLAIAGQMPGGAMLFQLAPDGSVAATAPPEGWPGSVALVAVAGIGGEDHVMTYDAFAKVLRLHAVAADGQMTLAAQTAPGALGGIAALGVAVVGETRFALVAEDGGTVAALTLSGPVPLEVTDRMGVADGLGIAALSQIVTATVAGETFVIAGAAGSSSLTVLHLDMGGQLTFADHVIDGLASRFQGVGALTVTSVGGRTYVVAGGADDGVSAFVLLPGGRLFHLGAFEDTVAASLQNVSGIHAFGQDGHLVIVASGEAEGGITRLGIDLGGTGSTLIASGEGGILEGTPLGDILIGGAGSDILSGGAGDDLIVDGAGPDTLTGGAGADVFIFDADGATDRITDFDPERDRIDLSRIPMLYDPADVDIVPTASGAELRLRGELLILHSATGVPLMAEDLTTALTINIDRPAYVPVAVPSLPGIMGTSGPDTLVGGDGDDTLMGGAGDDVIDAGGGNDLLIGGTVGLADPDWFARWWQGADPWGTDDGETPLF